MLKKFFITVLGTITGIWISTILLIITLLVAGVACISSFSGISEKPTKLTKNSVLHLQLSGVVQDRAAMPNISELIMNGKVDMQALSDITRAIRLAAEDKHIDALFIDAKGMMGDVADFEEIAQALEAFKSSGKKIFAYADTYSQGDYMLASMASEIYLNPLGAVDIHGVASAVPFFKGLLDKLDIDVQVVKVGTYKSAVEPFLLNEMSEPSRLQTQTYVDSLWYYMSDRIARNLGRSRSEIVDWASNIISTWTPEQALECGAVTELAYRRIAMLRMAEFEKCDVDDLNLINVKDYLAAKPDMLKGLGRHVAVLFAEGDIVDEGSTGISSETYVPEIISLADDDEVRGMVLRVNSGGGSAFASEQIWEALQYFKDKGKPLVVSMGPMAASGGYYISCGADYIFADTTTLTGSIGVFGMIPDVSRMASNKLGVNFSFVESNPNAVLQTPLAPMTPAQHQAVQNSVDFIYETFTRRVAEGRSIPQDSVKVIGEGRVWVGTDALRIGLVDRLGTLYDAIEYAVGESGVKAGQVAMYPQNDDEKFVKLLMQSGMVDLGGNFSMSAEALRELYIVNSLCNGNPVQARAIPVKVIF